MKTLGLIAAACAPALLLGAAEARTIYTYDLAPGTPSGSNAGAITSLTAQYDTLDQLAFSATIALRDDRPTVNGGWFVLSPGGMPTATSEELAIFYMDFDGGDLYAYQYNGASSEESWTDPSRYITTYDDVLSVENDGDMLTVGFRDLFVGAVQTAIGNGMWTGASFGEMFGGWIHFTALDEFASENGVITAFDTGWQSFLDVDHRATQVPEPAGLALLGMMGALGAAAYRRRKG